MTDSIVIQNPPNQWVRNLREDCQIWLVKEREMAWVVAPYTPSLGGHRTGRLFIRRMNRGIDYWFVSDTGRGIDGSLLMLPIQGSLPETPVQLTSKENEDLVIRISRLEERLKRIDRFLSVFGI